MQPLAVVVQVSPADSSESSSPSLFCYTRENSGHLSPATLADADVKDVMNKNLAMLHLKTSLQLHLSAQGTVGELAVGDTSLP